MSGWSKEEEEMLEKVKQTIKSAFNQIDLDVLNVLIVPHSKNRPYSSKEEYIKSAIERSLMAAKRKFNGEW